MKNLMELYPELYSIIQNISYPSFTPISAMLNPEKILRSEKQARKSSKGIPAKKFLHQRWANILLMLDNPGLSTLFHAPLSGFFIAFL